MFKVKCDNFLSLYDQEYIVPKKAAHYEAALQYLEQEDYLDAWDELAAAGDYKDSEEKLAETIDSLGGAAGISRIGYNYDVGDGVEQNYKLAFAWYKKAAELGSSYAMNNLGVLYQWGRGIEQDSEKATEWYQKAAELGNTTAMSNLGFMLLEKGSAQDYEEIFDLFKKAAEQGDSAAMSNLGHMYQNGYGTTQDYEKALHWYQKAADLGYAGAMYNLGTMYQDGLGIEQDYTKAFELYQKAAVLDDSMSFAMNNLGASYEFGHGTDIDFQKALEWYHKATEAGLNVSKDNIQRMLDSGKVTEEDLAKAGIEGYSVQSAAETDTTEIMTYTEYASADIDTPVCVETYVQAHQSWWDGKLTVYTQDQDGAYFIYNMACSEEDADRMVPGTKIRVTGYKAEWAGEVEIVDATFEYVEGDSFIAEPIDLTALLGTEDLVSYQNQLVAFKGMTVEAYDEIGAAFAYKNETGKTDDLYFKVSKNGKTYEFCVEYYLCGNDTDVYKAVEALKVGDIVDLEGFLYWYEGVNLHTTGISTGR